MTSAARAAWSFLAVLAGAAAGAYLLGAPLVLPNPWVSLRRRSSTTGRRQRVFIDDDGRIERGLPKKYRGILLRDLTQVSRQVSRARRRQLQDERKIFGRSAATFKTKDQAFRELMRANPQLRAFVEAHFGRDDQAFLKWRRGGRRGAKPSSGYADGRLDGINYTWDLHGKKSANNWTEAVYATIPDSRRWEDFESRLPVLEEATGLTLELPAPAARLERARGERSQYREGGELEVEEIYDSARDAATMQTGGELELEDAPF